MSPYYIDGKPIARVTEVVAAGECEATANIEKDPKMRKGPRTSHSVTLPGTLTHAKIQQMELRSMGQTTGGELYMDPVDKKLYAKIFAQHRKTKRKDSQAQTKYEDLMEKVDTCFANYLAFTADHPHKTILVEHRMLSKKYNCVTSVAHPYGYSIRSAARNLFKKYESILKKFDIFEAINGGNSREKNERAVKYIKKHNKGMTAGSDSHSIYTLGNVITYSKAKTVKEFLDNIKNKKNKVLGIENKLGKLTTYINFGRNKIQNLIKK